MAGVKGVKINVLDHSVEVKRGAKDREIFLSKKAWLALCACRTQLHEAIRFEKGVQHTLDKRKDIQVHTNHYKNKMYLHIRSWWNGRSSRTGVSMLIRGWDQVMLHLDPSDEMRLGAEVLRRMLKEGKLYLNYTPFITHINMYWICTPLHPCTYQYK